MLLSILRTIFLRTARSRSEETSKIEDLLPLAEQCIKKNEFDSADAIISRCEKLYPEDISTRIIRGAWHMAKQDYSAALSTLSDLPESTPRHLRATAERYLIVPALKNEDALAIKAHALKISQHCGSDIAYKNAGALFYAVGAAIENPLTPPPFESGHELGSITVIICSIDNAKYAQVVTSLGQALKGVSYEIIRISDASSLAEGYNHGMDLAKGQTFIFCHDDVVFLSPSTFVCELDFALKHADVVGVVGSTRVIGPTWLMAGPDHARGAVFIPGDSLQCGINAFSTARSRISPGVAVLDGLFLAMRSDVARAIRFDAELFDGFHLYDLDFSLRAYKQGFRLCAAPKLAILHISPGGYNETWRHYADIFLTKHGIAGEIALSAPVWAGAASIRYERASAVLEHLYGQSIDIDEQPAASAHWVT